MVGYRDLVEESLEVCQVSNQINKCGIMFLRF